MKERRADGLLCGPEVAGPKRAAMKGLFGVEAGLLQMFTVFTAPEHPTLYPTKPQV